MMPYILIITIYTDPAMPPGYGEWGGTHTYMHELLDSLDENGTDCILVTRRALEELPTVAATAQSTVCKTGLLFP